MFVYGNVLLAEPDDGTGGRPEVPRGELRRILLESLPADTVRWDTKLRETYLYDSDTHHKASAEAVGDGALFAIAPGKGILAHRAPNGTLHTYMELTKPKQWLEALDFSDTATALACVVKEFEGWAPELRALITDGETAPMPRPIYALPINH